MKYPVGQLRRAGFHIRAADIFIAFFFRGEFSSAAWAVSGHNKPVQLPLAPFARGKYRPHKLRYHIPRFAYNYGIADQDTFMVNFISIMQSRPRNSGARYTHRFQMRYRGNTPRTPHLH